MRKLSWLLICLLLISYAALAAADDPRPVIGTWEGESICTVRPSPCHDEHVIYDITADKEKLSISMDKVVNGERENMGALPCTYKSSTLRCTFRDTVWTFAIKDKQMQGELHLGDGTLYRRIKAQRK